MVIEMNNVKCEYIKTELGECHCWIKLMDRIKIRAAVPMIYLMNLPILQEGDIFMWNIENCKVLV